MTEQILKCTVHGKTEFVKDPESQICQESWTCKKCRADKDGESIDIYVKPHVACDFVLVEMKV